MEATRSQIKAPREFLALPSGRCFLPSLFLCRLVRPSAPVAGFCGGISFSFFIELPSMAAHLFFWTQTDNCRERSPESRLQPESVCYEPKNGLRDHPMRYTLALLASVVPSALSHGRMTVPTSRLPLWRDPSMTGHTSESATYRQLQPTHTLNGPMNHGDHLYSASSYRCHDFAIAPPSALTTVVAGDILQVEWQLEARHPGDCALYISYDEVLADPEGPSTWFKCRDRSPNRVPLSPCLACTSSERVLVCTGSRTFPVA